MAVPAPVTSSVKPVSPALNYVTLGTFSWDQDNEKVKVKPITNFHKSRLNFVACLVI